MNIRCLSTAGRRVAAERPTEPAPVEVLTDGHWVITLGFRGCDDSGQLAALDAATGDERWSIATAGGFGRRPGPSEDPCRSC